MLLCCYYEAITVSWEDRHLYGESYGIVKYTYTCEFAGEADVKGCEYDDDDN